MRSTKRRHRFTSLVAATLLAAACGAEAIVVPIIILTNLWAEEGNPDHTFQFNDDTGFVAKAEGTFTGTETLPDQTEFAFDGFWRDGRVELTVHRAHDVIYHATIPEDNANRLVYTSSAGTLVLVR